MHKLCSLYEECWINLIPMYFLNYQLAIFNQLENFKIILVISLGLLNYHFNIGSMEE